MIRQVPLGAQGAVVSMRVVFVVGVIWVAACSGAAPNDPEFSAERFKAHVTFLADDALEGREAGARGHDIAARYIASQLALLGVRPGGPDGTYFQAVKLIEQSWSNTPTLTVTTPSGRRSFEHGRDAMIFGSTLEPKVRLRAPLVFVGYGMKDASMGVDDYQGLDVRGKIVVALTGTPKGIDSEIGAHLLGEQRKVAAVEGAAGLITIPTRATSAAFPWNLFLQFASQPPTTWMGPDGRPHDPASALRASAAIEPAAAATLFQGTTVTLEQILDEADKSGGRPKGLFLAASAELVVEMTPRKYESPEVIGIIEGTDPTLKTEYVALMAHADHIGLKSSGQDRINNGVLDNAAGTATLLEVARALVEASSRPRRSVLIVANTAEEKGLLGADFFAHYPTVPIDTLTAAIDLDMPMLTYEFSDVVAYGGTHSTLETSLRAAAAEMKVSVSPDPMPEQAVFVRSDHYPLVKAGVPAVMLATGMANGGQDAWGQFLTTRYHQPSDDLSQAILWSAGARFAELNFRMLRALANADTRVRWYQDDYFGNLFAPRAPKVPRAAMGKR